MEEITAIAEAVNVPKLAIAGVSFVVGLFIGFAWGYILGKKTNKEEKSTLNRLASLIIILVWASSSTIDIFAGNQNTSTLLHLFMGVVVGTLNETSRNLFFKFFNRK